MRLITLHMSTCERQIVGAGSHAIRQKTTVDINDHEATIEIVLRSQLFARCMEARSRLFQIPEYQNSKAVATVKSDTGNRAVFAAISATELPASSIWLGTHIKTTLVTPDNKPCTRFKISISECVRGLNFKDFVDPIESQTGTGACRLIYHAYTH